MDLLLKKGCRVNLMTHYGGEWHVEKVVIVLTDTMVEAQWLSEMDCEAGIGVFHGFEATVNIQAFGVNEGRVLIDV